MSFEMQMKRTYLTSKLDKKFPRRAINSQESSHLSLRNHIKEMGIHTKYACIPWKHLYKFLLSRVDKEWDTVRKEMQELAESYSQRERGDTRIDSYMESEAKSGIHKDFEIVNGILRQVKKKHRSQFIIKAHKEFNRKNFDWKPVERIKEGAMISGPVFIGKLWVNWHGNFMKIPVYMIDMMKWEAQFGKIRYSMINRPYYPDKLQHLKDYKTVRVEGIGYLEIPVFKCLLTCCSSRNYIFIVKTSDIENYKKEKVS